MSDQSESLGVTVIDTWSGPDITIQKPRETKQPTYINKACQGKPNPLSCFYRPTVHTPRILFESYWQQAHVKLLINYYILNFVAECFFG